MPSTYSWMSSPTLQSLSTVTGFAVINSPTVVEPRTSICTTVLASARPMASMNQPRSISHTPDTMNPPNATTTPIPMSIQAMTLPSCAAISVALTRSVRIHMYDRKTLPPSSG
ncbi:unannotated protein [freshwater metagenome]|uniref:Unannotated protein n=1 Tax=freshwater metagenome TaxID=449393 RepID=A0A6J6I651_9ZZZZ